MVEKFLKRKGRALEEAFFANYNAKLLAELKERWSRESRLEALAEVSGIADRAVLKQLNALGLDCEAVAALTLMPLILVAWADRAVSEPERQAILAAAEQEGVAKGQGPYLFLEIRLHARPEKSLVDAWRAYAKALIATLDESGKTALRNKLLNQAEAVAEAAGGFLGLGNKISKAERAMLQELERELT